MGRRKKEVVDVVENPTPMVEDAMNLPVEDVKEESTEIETENLVKAPVEESSVAEAPLASEPVFKKIQCGASLVNVRSEPDGEVLFTIRNLSKVKVEEEKDGWCKISGFVMAELVKDL